MTIACLGWGSLVWQPGDLPVAGNWKSDGPKLPLEFARHSTSDRLTLVIVRGMRPVTSLWAALDVADLTEARDCLGDREGIPNFKHAEFIGSWPALERSQYEFFQDISSWARKRELAGVVWTSLPPKFHDTNGRVPTLEQAIEFLRSRGAESAAAEYVRRTPPQIRTSYREAFEAQVEWLRASEAG